MNRRQTKKELKKQLACPITLQQAVDVVSEELVRNGTTCGFLNTANSWPYVAFTTTTKTICVSNVDYRKWKAL